MKNDDHLQPYILENFGREKMLLLDCKTRWNSLLTMLEKFYELKKEIKLALVQLDVSFDLNDKEMKEINEMCEALVPFKAAVEALASEDADILLSEKIIAFVLKKLGELQSNISKELTQRFSIRIGERRNNHLVHLFEYLKKSSYNNQPEDYLGHKICRRKIAAMATNLVQRLFVNNGSDEVASNKEVIKVIRMAKKLKTQMTLAQELYAFVADDKNEEEQYNNVSSQVVQKEMMLYEITKTRPNNLEKLYAALKTIKPTSVEAERAFSVRGNFGSQSEIVLTMTPLMLYCLCAITTVNKLCLFYSTIVHFTALSIPINPGIM